MMPEHVIVGATRTPIGRFQGGLASVPAPRLGAIAIAAALTRAGVAPDAVSDVLMGQVLQAGVGQAPARQAAIYAGLPTSTRAVTVHKVCGSGLQTVLQATHLLDAGMASVVVAGGMENMSRAPYLLPQARDGYRLGHGQIVDSLVGDGLWDPYNDLHMGACAEQCARQYGFSREAQDRYAVTSFERAIATQRDGGFSSEIVPVPLGAGGSRQPAADVTADEGPPRVNFDKIATLRPAFDPAGTITAANASTLSDGAAALVLTTGQAAARLGIRPLARVISVGTHAQDPLWFTTAPVQAARDALARAHWTTTDVDLWEVNEAFAVVPMAFMQELGVPHDRVNVRGGAIALGHPIGCSGARIVVTLLWALQARDARRGCAAICIGGGEALAICIERV